MGSVRRRIINDFAPIVKGYINQSFTQSAFHFSVNDGVFYVKRPSSTNMNHFTTPWGSTPTTNLSQMSTKKWLEFKTGDTIKTVIHPINVISPGTIAVQVFAIETKTWAYTLLSEEYTVGDLSSKTKIGTISRDFTISGLNFYSASASKVEAYFRIEVYRNDIRII